jgi:hypothetical protein
MYRVKLNGGLHNEMGVTHKKGDEFISPYPLHEMFPTKFVLVGSVDPPPSRVKPVPPAPAPAPAPVQEDKGDDVSDEFPAAEKLGVGVYDRNDGYWVRHPKDGWMNTIGMKSKKDVNTFLKSIA